MACRRRPTLRLRARAPVAALALAGCGILAGCIDVRDFEGTWIGPVIATPALRQGFTSGTRVEPLVIQAVDLDGLSATLTTTDGRFQQTPLTRVLKYSNDTISSLTFDTSPLRSYLMFAPTATEPEGCPAHMLLSLFGDDRVELRVFRGNDLFGVFMLERDLEAEQ